MYNPSHPSDILREEYLKPLSTSVTVLARQLDVSRKALSEIINEKAGISPTMSIRLSKALVKSVQFWVTMQVKYDLFHAHKKSFKSIKAIKEVKWSQLQRSAA